MRKAQVVAVLSDSDSPDGPQWEIAVNRFPENVFRSRPNPNDVPVDVRNALREWLDSA